MAETESVVVAVKAMLWDLPESDRKRVEECRSKLLRVLVDYAEYGLLALTWLSAELADSGTLPQDRQAEAE